MDMRLLVAVLLAGMLAKMPAAQAERTPRRIDAAQWSLPSFRDAHPDLKHRLLAQQALDAGDYAIAIREFTRAADFGDKLSQAMLAELNLTGEGVAKDLARAYAWMDLAAERGFAPFVGKRESIWVSSMAPSNRRRCRSARRCTRGMVMMSPCRGWRSASGASSSAWVDRAPDLPMPAAWSCLRGVARACA